MTNMVLSDFCPEALKKKKAENEKDSKIMDLLSRFSAQMLLERLREDGGHPKSEWGSEESWRFYYHDECSRRGLRLLEQLNWPTEDNSLYVNLHTGRVEKLIDIATSKGYFADRYTIANQVWTVIEHWQPYDESKPNIYLIKYFEDEISRLRRLKANKKRDDYIRSDIRKIPELEDKLKNEKHKMKG